MQSFYFISDALIFNVILFDPMSGHGSDPQSRLELREEQSKACCCQAVGSGWVCAWCFRHVCSIPGNGLVTGLLT